MNNTKQNEVFFALFGWNFGRSWYARGDFYREGTPATVSFDFDAVWPHRDKLIGFYHTHPNWIAAPSVTDLNAMEALTTAFGKDLLCLIDGTNGLKAYEVDTEGNWYNTKSVLMWQQRFAGVRHKYTEDCLYYLNERE